MNIQLIQSDFVSAIKNENYESALSLLENHLELLENPTLETAEGISYLMLLCNEYMACIDFSTNAIKKLNSSDLHYNLAYAYEKMDFKLDAITHYQCSKLLSTDTEFRSSVTELIYLLRYPDESRETIELILKHIREVKNYIFAQLESPKKILDKKDYVRTEFPSHVEKKVAIFYGTMEIANHISHYIKYFRKNNYEAFGLNYYPSYIEYNCDLSISLESLSPDNLQQHYLLNAIDIIGEYDIFHFLFNTTLIPGGLDLLPLKRLNKATFMHNLGSEIRNPEIALAHHHYWKYAQDYIDTLNPEFIHNNLKALSSWIDNCIVNDYEMLSYVKDYYHKTHMIDIPISLEDFPFQKQVLNSYIHIVHAPTKRSGKGTLYFENAITKLSAKYPIKYTRVEHMSHKEAIEIYKSADIVLDQLIVGTYGSLSVECMALGKCVCLYINEKLQTPHKTEIPVWNVNIENVEDRLEELILNPEIRFNIGLQARKYVETYNDINIVGRRLLSIYEESVSSLIDYKK